MPNGIIRRPSFLFARHGTAHDKSKERHEPIGSYWRYEVVGILNVITVAVRLIKQDLNALHRFLHYQQRKRVQSWSVRTHGQMK